jgi:hypothetical protein
VHEHHVQVAARSICDHTRHRNRTSVLAAIVGKATGRLRRGCHPNSTTSIGAGTALFNGASSCHGASDHGLCCDATGASIRGQSMRTHQEGTQPVHDLFAELERHLIAAYVAGAGQDIDELLARTDEDAKRLRAEASRYASTKLGEIEARSQYLHKLHGQA